MDLQTHYKTNLKLAVPVMIGQLGHITAAVADSMMVGQLGTVPLAAAALANSLFSIFMVFGIGVSFGITPLIANADGKKGKHLPAVILHHGFWTNAILALLLYACIMVLSPLAYVLGQDPEVVPPALSYLNILSASIIPLLVFLSFKQFAEGLSDTRIAMAISVVFNVANVGLNYLLIFGNWGFPELGLDGAGWATLIARTLMMLTMWLYVMRHPKFSKLNLRLFHGKIRRKVIRRLLDLGIPSGFQFVFEVGAFALAAVFSGMISAVALAAHHIAINVASVTYMAVTGLGAAATVRVGNQMGRRDPVNLRRAANSLYVMAVSWMAFAGLVILIFRHTLADFYSDDPAVLALAAQMLIVVVLFQLSDGLQAIGLGALRGLQDVRVPTAISFVAYWILTLPAAYTLSQFTSLGVMGIWYALAAGLTISAVWLLIRFYRLLNHYTARLQ